MEGTEAFQDRSLVSVWSVANISALFSGLKGFVVERKNDKLRTFVEQVMFSSCIVVRSAGLAASVDQPVDWRMRSGCQYRAQ